MRGTWTRPVYLFFDTETTGLILSGRAARGRQIMPRLVQIGWLQLDAAGNELCAEEHLICPDGFVIPPEATRIHHITTERAKREGVALHAVLVAFEQMVGSSDTLVAHNMEFDARVICEEFSRSRLATALLTKDRICTMAQSAEFCALWSPYGFKWPKLEELHFRLFRTSLDRTHTALEDARATAKCFWELKRRGVL